MQLHEIDGLIDSQPKKVIKRVITCSWCPENIPTSRDDRVNGLSTTTSSGRTMGDLHAAWNTTLWGNLNTMINGCEKKNQ
jgi:hypothetical protein